MVVLKKAIAAFLGLNLFCADNVAAQDCSAENPCATGCCSTAGYCGVGDSYCAAENCVSTCDYQGEIDAGGGGECDANRPCAIGCCSKFGVCGLGPDYCSKDNCVSSCDAKANCNPGKWDSRYFTSQKCPLNVCCSEYGFCGTTTEFCGDKKVDRPSCKEGGRLSRVVGYFEGWASRRACNDWWPEMIPTDVYTHINFAFASIDPKTYKVIPADSRDENLYSRLTDLKLDDSNLRVNIALGGWTFNDPGSTQRLFSEIAASKAKQDVFFESLASFLATYNFDGVDIDWEYPVDTDRGGSSEDFKNFPKFMAALKKSLRGTAGRDGLSVTLPASYWYLQHFDLDELAKHVDYFNVMSYDLHGLWDKGNRWTGNYLDSHTNLTEIKSALDLIWRNNVHPSQVVLGLAFYGRSFTLDSPLCTSPGCTYSSTGKAGPCSNTDGILMNKEIDDIVKKKDLKPSLDKTAAIQSLTWDDQWVTYDDETTLKLKIKFSQSECLGGVMVWALTHDTKDGKYASALAALSGRPSNFQETGALINGKRYETHTEKKQYQQCKWSGCGESCPSGYVMVERGDDGADDGELMMDETGCSDSIRTFCCPTSARVPKCGWYTHNNGKCDPDCPSGMFEIGGNSKYCNNDKYQAACCDMSADSIKLYTTTEWAGWPDCDSWDCPFSDSSKDINLTQSATGSGGSSCDLRYGLPRSSDDPPLTFQERKLCYKGKEKKSWTSCDWKGRNCPEDMVQLALDVLNHDSVATFCCYSDYYTEKTTQTVHVSEFRKALSEWIEDPLCPDDDEKLEKRGEETTRAALLKDYQLVLDDLTTMFRQRELGIDQIEWATDWDDLVAGNRSNMTIDNLRDFNLDWSVYEDQGPKVAARTVLCNLDLTKARIDGTESMPTCGGNLCLLDEDLCAPEDDVDNPYSYKRGDDESNNGLKRRDLLPSHQERNLELLEKRTDRQITLECPNQSPASQSFTITNAEYTSSGAWASDNKVYDRAFDFREYYDCGDAVIHQYEIPTGRFFATEHIIEIQNMKQFFAVTTSGKLVSGATATKFMPVPCELYVKQKILRQQLLANDDVTFAGGIDSPQPEVRIMDALGSKTNTEDFVLLQEQINGMKARIMIGGSIHSKESMKKYLDGREYPTALLEIKTAIAVYSYLRDPEVNLRMQRIIYHIRQQLELTDAALLAKYPAQAIDLASAWDEYLLDLLGHIQSKSRLFIATWLSAIKTKAMAEEDEYYAKLIEELCDALAFQAGTIVRLDASEIVHGYSEDNDGDAMDTSDDGDDDGMDLD